MAIFIEPSPFRCAGEAACRLPCVTAAKLCSTPLHIPALKDLTAVALCCSHVSGMKIRFLTLIEELRRAGDEVRHVSRTKFTTC